MDNFFESKKNLDNLIEILKDKLNDEVYLSVWTQGTFARICFIVNSIYELQIMLNGSNE